MVSDIQFQISELCSSLELRTLDLSQNNLSYLPADFVKMTDLRHLQLECNPLRSPPMEIVELVRHKTITSFWPLHQFVPRPINISNI